MDVEIPDMLLEEIIDEEVITEPLRSSDVEETETVVEFRIGVIEYCTGEEVVIVEEFIMEGEADMDEEGINEEVGTDDGGD